MWAVKCPLQCTTHLPGLNKSQHASKAETPLFFFQQRWVHADRASLNQPAGHSRHKYTWIYQRLVSYWMVIIDAERKYIFFSFYKANVASLHGYNYWIFSNGFVVTSLLYFWLNVPWVL